MIKKSWMMCWAGLKRGRMPTRLRVSHPGLRVPRRTTSSLRSAARSQLHQVWQRPGLLHADANPLRRRTYDNLLQVHLMREAVARGLTRLPVRRKQSSFRPRRRGPEAGLCKGNPVTEVKAFQSTACLATCCVLGCERASESARGVCNARMIDAAPDWCAAQWRARCGTGGLQ